MKNSNVDKKVLVDDNDNHILYTSIFNRANRVLHSTKLIYYDTGYIYHT